MQGNLAAVARAPSASMLSFTPMGIPCSGLRNLPAACSSASVFACASALSPMTVIQALILGL